MVSHLPQRDGMVTEHWFFGFFMRALLASLTMAIAISVGATWLLQNGF
jgi:hypothetical protein